MTTAPPDDASPSDDVPPVERVGGRVLLLDPDDRVLLIHERIEDASTHWLTPGGGVEAGEDPRDAAVREAMEEVGIAVEIPASAAAVLVTRRQWSWAGVDYDQTDHFYLARVGRGARAVPHALTPMEQQTLLGQAWWTLAELRDTAETIVPPDLAAVLEPLLANLGSTGGSVPADGR